MPFADIQPFHLVLSASVMVLWSGGAEIFRIVNQQPGRPFSFLSGAQFMKTSSCRFCQVQFLGIVSRKPTCLSSTICVGCAIASPLLAIARKKITERNAD